ncbi:MAG: hypothetical protein LBS52_01830 [Dysgonamonadaceae bacterium]|jgi:hypothetical protein|nr:hypothetical protein [Dysgonamonadaceae bacterium]
MKRTFLVLSLFVFIFTSKIHSQNWQDYVQFGAGVGMSWMGDEYGALLRAEYGKTYKWLDLSLSLSYESEMDAYNANSHLHIRPEYPEENNISKGVVNNDVSVSLSFNAKIDVVRLFTENSNHSFKVGGGIGCEHSMEQSADKDNINGYDHFIYG